ncbi:MULTISPECIES: type II secretion system F family protein [Streptomyces]|jgi:tight adherence protein B|uniref:Type II secretion system F family protein n=1 Tax=Streptomyces sp. 900116325 TaxID=3154295 RepID=A0ABV2U0R0_9ACTN|nr:MULTISPECIES: type II secretion system F family protein [unclassified Streptomyces]MDX2727605.1 type II secretion system F family protein [Streptomyces sp. PA03-2a]MDX3764904.1 type II secretion system F family protein [Streptomyces sp. AK08-01B]MDX3814483.1 type II secretion system F family protein [Streptomyces sp. AK08-01A]WSQ27693.1 type II secretion system F family protein [Streptomyces sp. NBC_01230]SCY58258.1 tight adherence protein B [Streptomyces sp. 136MFCol5.1]
MNNLPLLTIGVTLLFGVTGVMGLYAYSGGKADRDALVDRLSHTGQIPAAGRHRRFQGVDRRLRKTGLGRRLELKLAATGLEITPGEFFVYALFAMAVLWMAASSILASFFGPVAALIGLWGTNAFLNWQRTKRTERFINQLPELSRILANATQAGLALRTAISMAADEMEDPAGEELARVARRLAVGESLDDAMSELTDRLPSRELVVLVTTLVLSNRAGGTVVSSLRNLTETLEERKETRREVKTQLSQVTVTAYAVPVFGFGAMLLMNAVMPGALDRMTGALIGQVAVIVSLVLYTIGFIVIRRMSRIDV